MNILFAVLIQAPVVPVPKPVPEINITVERFMLKGEEPTITELYESKNNYF